MVFRYVLSYRNNTWHAYCKNNGMSFENKDKNTLIVECKNSIESSFVRIRKNKLIISEKTI